MISLEPHETQPSIPELVQLCKTVARVAGEYVRENTPERVEVAATKTTDTDVVTAMDRACEQLIKDAIAAERPADGFLGEESAGVRGSSGLTWVVDPIDGTVNYLYGLDSYAVSVAVVAGDPTPAGWDILAGAIYDIPGGEIWWAGQGQGAWHEGRQLRIEGAVPLDKALVGTGFGYAAARRAYQAALLTHVLPQIRDIRRIGSAALDLCRVAAGRLDALYEIGLHPWDYAAGTLLVTEAGGITSGLGAEPVSEEMFIAGSGSLVAALRDSLERAAREIAD